MPVSITHKGNFDKTERFAKAMSRDDIFRVLDAAGRVGVTALASATPVNSGMTAASWSYTTESTDGGYAIHWTNSNTIRGFNVAIGLQMGHGTGTGGYVVGRNYINPAIRPIFDTLAATVWKEVQQA